MSVAELRDRVEGLSADLDSALEIIWKHGDRESLIWLCLNYPREARHFMIYDKVRGREAAVNIAPR